MRLKPLLGVIILMVTLLMGLPVSAQSVVSLSLTVYEDGYVLVNETISTANYSVVLDVPLLGQHVEGLLALDENRDVLPAEINGSNVTVYFGNASLIRLSYYTPDLTSKEGAIWTVSLQSPIPVEIILPKEGVIVDLSDIPLEIRGNIIVMPAGNVSVSYIIPIQTSTITTTSSSNGSPPTSTTAFQTSTTSTTTISTTSHSTVSTTSSSSKEHSTSSSQVASGGSSEIKWIGMGIIILLVLGGVYLYFGRNSKKAKTRSGNPKALERFRQKIEALDDLNDDERGALLFLLENGGKAPQSKVREALGLPKTTAWRMFKRLGERGLVRVYKLGRENWVELVLE